MLPLEQPGYNPRILVIGGSSANFAGPDTPATPATYLLDFSIRPLAWVREDMSSPRVMPDGVLLPDGMSFYHQDQIYQAQAYLSIDSVEMLLEM